jgi:hypothetical protein
VWTWSETGDEDGVHRSCQSQISLWGNSQHPPVPFKKSLYYLFSYGTCIKKKNRCQHSFNHSWWPHPGGAREWLGLQTWPPALVLWFFHFMSALRILTPWSVSKSAEGMEMKTVYALVRSLFLSELSPGQIVRWLKKKKSSKRWVFCFLRSKYISQAPISPIFVAESKVILSNLDVNADHWGRLF